MSIEDKLNTLNGYIETLATDTKEHIRSIEEDTLEPDYLCFTAEMTACTIRLYKSDASLTASLEYSMDKKSWYPYTWIESKGGFIVNLNNIGDKVWFRGDNDTFSTSESAYFYFEMSGLISASGNVMSLLDKTCMKNSVPQYAFNRLFINCASLTTAPKLPATYVYQYCYANMFQYCSSLKVAPELPATPASYCYKYMFQNCTSLVIPPTLPSTTLAEGCYSGMFTNCRTLVSAPELPATTLVTRCYSEMFYYCVSLTSAPALSHVTTLANYCCQYMFQNCKGLVNPPTMPASTVSLAQRCYYHMFNACENLVNAPELPATTLAYNCYSGMFFNCISLKKAPALPATTLQNGCYQEMFSGCTSLEDAPTISATTLAPSCCKYMFYNCTSLKIKSAGSRAYSDFLSITLSATTMATSAYESMFEGCVALTSAPYLVATTLANDCYKRMFYGCKNLQYVRIGVKDVTSTYATDWLTSTFAGGGVIVCPHDDTSTVVPNAYWTKVDIANPVVYEDFPTCYNKSLASMPDGTTIAIMSGSKTMYLYGLSENTKTFYLRLGNRGYENFDTSRFIITLAANLSVVSGDNSLIIPTPLVAGKKNICVYVRDAPNSSKCYLYLVAVED